MFYFDSLEQFQNASARLNEHKRRVKMIEVGKYKVQSVSNPEHFYDVFCGRDVHGRKFVSCSCLTKDGVVCSCGTAAAIYHVAILKLRGVQAAPKPTRSTTPTFLNFGSGTTATSTGTIEAAHNSGDCELWRELGDGQVHGLRFHSRAGQ